MSIFRYGATGFVIGVLLGGIVARSVEFAAFASITGSLLVIFSILTGLLAQVMVFTAMIVTPEKIAVSNVNALEEAFTKQQREWRVQFFIYLIAVVTCAIAELFKDSGVKILTDEGVRLFYVWACASISITAIIRSLRIPAAIVSLQHLRFDVIRDEMKAAEELLRQRITHGSERNVAGQSFKGRPAQQGHGSIIEMPRP